MTTSDFTRFINLYRWPTGRRLFALSRMREIVGRVGLTDLVPWIEAALEADDETRRLELRWRGASVQPVHGPRAAELDAELDRALSGLDEALGSRIKVHGPDSEPGRLAAELREEVFPRGVYAVTSLPYVEQHETVTVLAARLTDPDDLYGAVEALGLADDVMRIGALNVRYGGELQAPAPRVGFEAVRAAREVGHTHLTRLVALVLAATAEDTDADREVRAELLGPVVDQNEAVRRRYQRRRGVVDVDPTTGVEEAVEEAAEEAALADALAAEVEAGEADEAPLVDPDAPDEADGPPPRALAG